MASADLQRQHKLFSQAVRQGITLVADPPTGDHQSESTWNENDVLGDAAGGGGQSILYRERSTSCSPSTVASARCRTWRTTRPSSTA